MYHRLYIIIYNKLMFIKRILIYCWGF